MNVPGPSVRMPRCATSKQPGRAGGTTRLCLLRRRTYAAAGPAPIERPCSPAADVWVAQDVGGDAPDVVGDPVELAVIHGYFRNRLILNGKSDQSRSCLTANPAREV